MKAILDGIRVVDWTLYQVGPYASAMLADLGAEVIHVEHRVLGDLLRGFKTFLGIPLELPGGRHISFEEHNRNKKGLAIDLKKPEGREAIYRLVERSDVFLTNFRPRAVARLGFDYQTLRRYNQGLIYASASGFGRQGPESESPSLDLMACARSAAAMTCGEADTPPVMLASGIGDRIASICLAYGIVAALLGRERLGVGQELHVSQLASMITLQGWALMPTLLLGREYPRHRRAGPRNPLYNYYRCQDGRWLALALVPGITYWPTLCQALGAPELEQDPRFADDESRAQNSEALVSLLDRSFATRTSQEWQQAFREAGDLIFTVVNTPSDLLSDPQVVANRYVVDWDHPALGPIKFIPSPVEFSQTPATLRSPAPEFGQHTEEVLLEICGYTWEEIGQLKEQEVI